MASVRIEKRNHRGELVWSYAGEEVERGDHYIVLSAFFDRDDRDDGYFVWQRGDRFLEWHYTDRWYNVFKIFDRETGAVRGWYCNITRPALLTGDTVSADDLELDVFIYASGAVMLKDEADFAALDLSPEDRARALEAADAIQRLAAAKRPPFDGI